MPVAPRIVNDVPYVTKINHESHFAWQAQYLVRLQGDACCSAHCNSELIILFLDMVVAVCIYEVDQSWLLHAAVPCFVNDVS